MADLHAVRRSLLKAEYALRSRVANQRAPRPVVEMRAISVLLVEDEVILRFSTAEDLRGHGYTVIEAAHGDEALAVLRSGARIEAVVTDLRMPGTVDGRGLVRAIREEFPGLKVVMVSAELPDADLLRQLDGFFPKPVATHQISAVLQAFDPGA